MSSAKERRRNRLVAQAEAALERLATDPRDLVAKGSLHEAVTGLEHLLDDEPDLRRRLIDDSRREHLSHDEPPPLPIRTERLLLRRRESRDTPELHDIYGRTDVAKYLLHDALTLDELEERFARQAASDEDAIGFVVEIDGRAVGQVALIFHGPLVGELAWTIHPDVGGRGVATEAARALLDVAFGHYGLHRVKAELDARNDASRRLCQRLGMRQEGHRIADFWSKGEWTDTYEYGLLASEWAEAPRGSRH